MKKTKNILLALAVVPALLNAKGFRDVEMDKRTELVQQIKGDKEDRSGVYVGLGYVYGDLEYTSGPLMGQDSYGTLTGIVGYKMDNYMSIEARYSTMASYVQEASLKEVEIGNYGVYLKPTFSMTENLGVYALLGWTKIDTGTSDNAIRTTTNNLGYGAGVSYSIAKPLRLFVDCVDVSNPLKNKEIDFKTKKITFGATYLF